MEDEDGINEEEFIFEDDVWDYLDGVGPEHVIQEKMAQVHKIVESEEMVKKYEVFFKGNFADIQERFIGGILAGRPSGMIVSMNDYFIFAFMLNERVKKVVKKASSIIQTMDDQKELDEKFEKSKIQNEIDLLLGDVNGGSE